MKQEELSQLGKEMREQDNLATGHPLYCVFEKERIHGVEDQGDTEYEWKDEDWNTVTPADYEMTEEEAEASTWPMKYFYIDRDRFVNAHFTTVDAKRYIEENNHNLNKGFVYVTSLYRCHRMIAIQEFLKSGGEIE
jgi:hypothetical protein